MPVGVLELRRPATGRFADGGDDLDAGCGEAFDHRVDASLREAEDHLGSRSSHGFALQEDELDIPGQASLEVAAFDVLDLERQTEGFGVEAPGASEVGDEEDDADVFDLAAEHGTSRVAVPGSDVSTSPKISP